MKETFFASDETALASHGTRGGSDETPADSDKTTPPSLRAQAGEGAAILR